jgi:geranylgeranyl diphosphate synthase, type I
LLAWTDQMLRDCGLPATAVWRGLGVLDTMRTEVFAGQFLDLAGQALATSALDRALTVMMYKSAKYTVERPLHLGAALAAAARPEVFAALTSYGIPLGVAFQLRDDILGVFGDPARTGKPVTGDLREGKRTALLALASERADERQSGVLGRAIGNPGLTERGAERVRSVITETGALAECEAMIDRHVKEAVAALEAAPVTAESKTALAHLAVAATSRSE